ncbi:hypothetical protein [Saccharothrix australiensis]|uniref:hypothetical protein n=1 Tax=Saccharothrix australiensis TaxID=2072 RepID=UPI000EABEDA9|nr:hypothetical protein [Saccharothrix australiensis]
MANGVAVRRTDDLVRREEVSDDGHVGVEFLGGRVGDIQRANPSLVEPDGHVSTPSMCACSRTPITERAA